MFQVQYFLGGGGQAVLFAGDVETLSPGNHEKVTGNFNENPRVITLHILTGKLSEDNSVETFLWHLNFLATEIPFCHSKEFPVHKRIYYHRKPFPVTGQDFS